MADPKNRRPSRPTPPPRPSRPALSASRPTASLPEPAPPEPAPPERAKDPHDETTARNVLSPELLSSLRDESERVTVKRRIVIGPDGVPRVLDDDEDEDETTRRIATRPRDDE